MTAQPSPPSRRAPEAASRLAPKPFAAAVVAVYLLSFLSQVLLAAPVTERVNVWAFAAAQLVLVVVWVKLHRWRLRDAGRPSGVAIGIAIIYVLEIVLLVLVVGLLLSSAGSSSGGVGPDAPILQFFVILYLLALMTGDPNLGALQAWMIGFAVVMLLPVVIALVFSVWAATRPRTPDPP
jgi:hypothetical protein